MTTEQVYEIWLSFHGGKSLGPRNKNKFIRSREAWLISKGDPAVIYQAAEDLFSLTGKLLLKDWAQKVPRRAAYREDATATPRQSSPRQARETRAPADNALHRQVSNALGSPQPYL